MASNRTERSLRAKSKRKRPSISTAGKTSGPQATAKLSPPRIPRAVPRERLFETLDRHSACPLVWISGPPGCGKTTLAAIYVRRTPCRVLWYRADSQDTDLATLFHSLRKAALAVTPDAAELPILGPEYVLDVTTFARNFLRMLFELLRLPAALVFDNVHDAPPALFDTLLTLAVAELPEKVRLFAISRAAPSPLLSGLQVKGQLFQLEGARLTLTMSEATAIAEARGVTDAAVVRRHLQRSQGWTAGFVLLVEHTAQLSDHGTLTQSTRTAFFSYFANELLAQAPSSARRLLLCTALLPSFTLNQASAFMARDDAQAALDWLSQRNYFIETSVGPPVTFRYHDLFRDFLLERGRRDFTIEERATLLMHAARCAETADDAESALALWLEAASWADALRVICALAPQTLAQGRGASLERWIAALPDDIASTEPWALYWRGVAQLGGDPRTAREILTRAHPRFVADGQAAPALLCCAHIVQTFFVEWDDQHPMDPWLEIFRCSWEPIELRIPLEMEVQILPQVIGAMLRHAGDPILDKVAARANYLLERMTDPALLMPLAFVLAIRYQLTGQWREGVRLLSHLERTIPSPLPPVLQLLLCAVRITWHTMCAETASQSEGRAQLERYFKLSEASGIHTLDIFTMGQGVYFAIAWNDLALADALIIRMRRALIQGRTLDVAHFNWLWGLLCLQRGDIAEASAAIASSVEKAAACGAHLAVCQNRLLAAQLLHAQGDTARGIEELDLALAYSERTRGVTMQHAALLIKAYLLIESGRYAEGRESLSAGLALGRTTGQSIIAPAALSRITRRLYAIALEEHVETDYVRSLIRTYRIQPLNAGNANWPWPVQIFTLGRFAVLKDGEPLRFLGKTPRKPLHLLQALIAQGGRGVAVETLTRQVWRQSSREAKPNFNVALVRLRRLLGYPEALILSGGRLSLDEQLCWVDCWVFEHAVDRLGEEKIIDERGALSLYGGTFLAAEHDIASITKTRDRLHAKFQRAVLHLGQLHERADRLDSAAAVYRRGLEEDTLYEEFHRRLMYCEWQIGNRAEAIRTYRRCRDLLASSLSVKPSQKTEALYRTIMAEESR
jgi:LuxR family transcriptional regulator, maltose regulon positive regulatory protein